MNGFIEKKAGNRSISHRGMVHGVGINDADYEIYQKINGKGLTCHFYRTWESMLKRCYSKKYKLLSKTYDGCFVCDEWLIFSNFKSWMENQDWLDKCLDKDLLVYGNKEYHPDKCMFVDQRVNKLLTGRDAMRGQYAIGVSFHKTKMKFSASCNNGTGKLNHLGYFKTEYEAANAYREFKRNVILGVANEQKEIIKQALIRIVTTHYEELSDE